jgi:hypothetical protein
MSFYLRMAEAEVYISDTECVPFVAKMQKAKTRKDKDYFVLRATVPKDVVKKINAKPGDYLFFRAKKAQWYHMLDWTKMESTWRMLPIDVKRRVVLDGLYCQGAPGQPMSLDETAVLGATNLSKPVMQIANVLAGQSGETYGSSI